MTGITRQLAEFVASLNHDGLPPQVRERAQLIVFDHIGIALRSRHEATLSPGMEAGLRRMGLAAGNSTVIGDAQGYVPSAAALFNGNLGHALDFDDTHAPGSIHCGAPIIPAALAAAEMCGADGKTVIAGVVAGFETQIRLSLALNPSELYKRGFHPTPTCGVFGAAAAAGLVLGLDADGIERAFGLCGSQAAGSMQFLVDGSWNKPYHTGFAAANGLTSACMAAEGFRGSLEAFEGKSGFLHAYAPAADPQCVVAGLGNTWETLNIAVKPYPSCRYGHAAMDALIDLRAANDLDWRSIEAVEIGLPQTGVNIIGEPQAEKRTPSNYVDGQFSMPFVAAVALRDGAMDWDSYARHLGDADTLALCAKISTINDALAEAQYPANMSGVARVHTGAGTFEKLIVVPKGEPDNFMSGAEFSFKFDALVSPYLSDARRAELSRRLANLAEQTDISALLALTRPDLVAGHLRVADAGDD
ncbi:MAG: 2-methylcitrate dehydratase PrpD [Gammaproteobacteria bacterium]|jgi:2-methylcitrate dehydratase PrpD